MRTHLFVVILIAITCSGCVPNETFIEHASSEFYTNNEDHFSFLVFDKLKVDTFFANYTPVDSANEKLKRTFTQLFNTDFINSTADTFNFSKHTQKPKYADFEFAKTIFKATTEKNGERYFWGSVVYLFFFDCLPNELKYKWTQTRLGDFEFNVTFFNRLRTNCKVFDQIIYGETGYWDKNIRSVFREDIFNEITAENAIVIKNCLINDPVFADKRLKIDKDNFLIFLDRTIHHRWRLFLMDNN